MPKTAERVEDRLADFTRDRRILLLSFMALVIGSLSAVIAKILVLLIAIFTNLTFYQRFSSDFVSPSNHHLGKLVIIAPVIGGLIIGLMARYGSEKIRGHGIPEALEAILFGPKSHGGQGRCLGRASVMTARLRRLEEEHDREVGWLQAALQ